MTYEYTPVNKNPMGGIIEVAAFTVAPLMAGAAYLYNRSRRRAASQATAQTQTRQVTAAPVNSGVPSYDWVNQSYRTLCRDAAQQPCTWDYAMEWCLGLDGSMRPYDCSSLMSPRMLCEYGFGGSTNRSGSPCTAEQIRQACINTRSDVRPSECNALIRGSQTPSQILSACYDIDDYLPECNDLISQSEGTSGRTTGGSMKGLGWADSFTVGGQSLTPQQVACTGSSAVPMTNSHYICANDTEADRTTMANNHCVAVGYQGSHTCRTNYASGTAEDGTLYCCPSGRPGRGAADTITGLPSWAKAGIISLVAAGAFYGLYLYLEKSASPEDSDEYSEEY